MAQTILMGNGKNMESEAFRALFGDYGDVGGDDGYIHSVVQPAMNMLKIVEMDEIDGKMEKGRMAMDVPTEADRGDGK